MRKLKQHWTERSLEDFLHKVSLDFVQQIENYLSASGETQKKFAERLNLSSGRVSQVLNSPGNLSLKKIIEYARAAGKKVAIVAYDDNDPTNASGPINSQVFEECWIRCGRPRDFFALEDSNTTRKYVLIPGTPLRVKGRVDVIRANSTGVPFAGSNTAGTGADAPFIRLFAEATNHG